MATRPADNFGASTSAPGDAPGPDTYEAVLDRVFLTPRVIDQRSVEDLSGALKGLVRDAAAQQRSLAASAAEVKGLSQHLREATGALQVKIEAAAKVAPALDQRVAKAEQLLDATVKELSGRVREAQELAARSFAPDREVLARAVREAATQVIASIIAEQAARFRDELQERVAAAAAEIDDRSSQAQQLIRVVAHEVANAVQGASARADSLVSRANAASASFDQVRDRMDEALRSAGERGARAAAMVEQAAARAEESRANVDAAAAEAGVRLGAAITEAERRSVSIIQQTDARLRELESRVATISAQAQAVDADRIVGLARQTGEVTAEAAVVCHELRDLLSRVEAVQRACEANALRLESLRDQTGVAHGTPGEPHLSGADGIDEPARGAGPAAEVERLESLLAQADLMGRGLDRLVREAERLTGGADSRRAT